MVGPRGVVGALGAGAGGSDRKGLRKEACYTVSNLVAGSRQQLKVPPPPAAAAAAVPPPRVERRRHRASGYAPRWNGGCSGCSRRRGLARRQRQAMVGDGRYGRGGGWPGGGLWGCGAATRTL